jgi:tetratricopeptide (TPR) repeat protein
MIFEENASFVKSTSGHRDKYPRQMVLNSRLLVIFLLVSFLILPNSLAEDEKVTQGRYGNYLKGLFYAEEGNYEASLKELQKLKKLDPASIYVRLKIASLLIRMSEMDKAEAELKEAKQVNPQSFDASLALIFLYSYGQKPKELEREYEEFLNRAHNAKPEDTKISEYLAQYYFYKKQYSSAIKIYEEILKKNPNYAEGLLWLGFIYDEMKNRDEAIKAWKRALAIDPQNALILNALGYAYAQEGKNLDEAENMIKKALQKEPANGAYLDSLGWVYFKKRNYKKAQEYLKLAIQCQDDPVIYEHVGDVYMALKDKAHALDYYKKGLQNFPQSQELKYKIDKYGKEDKASKK